MGIVLSPGVERARDAARQLAAENGVAVVRLSDWFLALTADEDSKPAQLLQRIGVNVPAVREAVVRQHGWVRPPAPDDTTLFAAARERATALGGDVTLTTEFVLLAVLTSDEHFRDQLRAIGVRSEALEDSLRPDHYEAVTHHDPGPTFTVTDPADQVDTARVLDVNLNRIREALRVLDDYCRFVRNDRILTEELKQARHDVAAAARRLPSLVVSRDTPGDVGTTVTTESEYVRRAPSDVAAVNLKRLQEALRSAEEYGKVFGIEFARALEQVRYRIYALERALAPRSRLHAQLADARLYVLLTGSQCAAALDWTIAEAAAGGARVFQLREKDLPDRELLARARNVRRWTRDAGSLFIMNDRPDLARLCEADGVHLGQDDLPVHSARRIVGPDALIGVSVHTPDQLRRAVLEGADSIGVGPTFPSRTKNFDQFPGLALVQYAAAETTLPTFVLGGINPTNIAQVIAAGGRRIAVSAAIATADDPQSVARQLVNALSVL